MQWLLITPDGQPSRTTDAPDRFTAAARFAPVPPGHWVVSAASFRFGFPTALIAPRCVSCHVKPKYDGANKCRACLRSAERSARLRRTATATTLALVVAACLGYAEGWERDFRRWEAGIVATCPNHSAILHQPTPWEAAHGRRPRLEQLPHCTPT